MKPEVDAPAGPNLPDPPTGRRRRGVPGWLRVVISLLLVAALLFYVDLGQVGRILAASRLDLVACLLALVLALRLLSAYRWFVLLRSGSPGLSLMRIVRISFVSVFAGTFLPGGIGSEAIRIYGAARASRTDAGEEPLAHAGARDVTWRARPACAVERKDRWRSSVVASRGDRSRR